ncbi:MAG: TonB-dependent receptor [Muribaculaceae bacterium]|nr:TonB-dependent receptor [Muribaculaceae bacterium]MDE6772917.1 TonB-dependent receptor [Muribaculaceae bacterium]
MKKYILTICLALLGLTAMAQEIAVSGLVVSKSDGEPLIGATVRVKGTSKGTATDIDGKYSLKDVASDATLVFNYVGYQEISVPVNGRNVIDVEMEETASSLDELVVVGYGVAKKSDLTSSISTIKGSELNEMVTGNAMDAIQGRVPGVQVATGGGPGTTPKVMIRGVTTVGDSSPLYVVDGVPLNASNINFINNNDIESMEVLKDASASAIYGTRASNGVIIITTKKGKSGQTHVDFSASVGWQHIDKPSIAWADEYEKVFNTRYANDGRVAPWNSPYVDYAEVDGTDWWKEVVKPAALVQNYSLSVRGGNDKYVYSLSVGYFKTDSQFEYGYWDKLNVRLNTEFNFTDWLKAGIDLAPNMEKWDNTPGVFGAAMSMDPTTPVFRPESEWDPSNPMNNYQRSYNNQEWNPVASVARMDNSTTKMQLLMNPYVQVQPIRQLTLRTQFGVNAWYQRNDYYDYAFHIDALEQNIKDRAGRNYTDQLNWTWNNTITFMDTFADKHNLTVMAGFTAERYAEWWNQASRQDIPGMSDLLHEVSAGTGDQFASGNSSYTTLASFLGRVMYNYDSRYYLTASIRTDGSSKFPAGNKWATFPSVSVAWRLSEEAFMENTRSWLDNAKIRLGWGKVGNQNINPGLFLSTLNNGVNYVFGSTPTRYPSTILGQMGNPNLKWETVEDIDFGIDATFLNSRLNVTFDLYQKTSHDMLYARQSQLIMGLPTWMGALTQNIGKMRARGWELSINWNDKAGEVGYNVGLQLSSVRNKAIKFSGDGPVWGGSGMSESIIRNEDGGLISRFYGYQADGLFQNWEEVYAHTDEHGTLIQPDAQPGDIRFLDLNHDGQLNDADKKYIGNPYPDLMVGFNLGLNWKGWDFLANFYGTFGNDIFNLQKMRYSGNSGQNVYQGTLEAAWHGEGTSNDIPRLSYNDLNQNYGRVSSFFVEDGSYFRCKLLTLGYTLPQSIMGDFNLRLYFSAQNLFTFTKYKGMDPERPFYDGGSIETGIDRANYPTPKTFLFGVDFKF